MSIRNLLTIDDDNEPFTVKSKCVFIPVSFTIPEPDRDMIPMAELKALTGNKVMRFYNLPQRGDTIDFVVDGRGRDTAAGFTWAPILRMDGSKLLWDSAKDFNGSPAEARHYGAWERYAQVLLEANEFIFLD